LSLIYRALWYGLLPLGAIWHLIFIWRRPEFRFGFWQRYGWVPRDARKPLVVHAASVGEVNAVADMLLQISQQANIPLVVTTTTATGRDRCLQLFAEHPHIQHCYMPFDLGISQRLFLQRLQPRGVLLVETELWPNMLRLCPAHVVPVWLINGRLSQRSAKSYQRFKSLTRTMLDNLQRFLVQDKASARRFAHIGADRDKLQIMGSVKFDLTLPPPKHADLAQQWLDDGEPCWVCGSTREGEEATLLQVWNKMTTVAKGLLVLVPRHPQRFEEVADICAQSGLPWRRYSEGASEEFLAQTGKRVLLVDAMGLLIDFYRLADITLVGGSLADKGGQNPLEAAALGKPVLMGPNTFNFASVCELLQQAGNLQLVTAHELIELVPRLFEDEDTRKTMGQAGIDLVAQQAGATQAYVSLISKEFVSAKNSVPNS